MKLLIISILILVSPSAWACTNLIAESEIPKAIALQPRAGSIVCRSTDPCICFDGVDWETAIYNSVTKTFSVDPAKLSAKQARITADQNALAALKATRAARLARLKVADLASATTLVQVKIILQDILDEVKDK